MVTSVLSPNGKATIRTLLQTAVSWSVFISILLETAVWGNLRQDTWRMAQRCVRFLAILQPPAGNSVLSPNGKATIRTLLQTAVSWSVFISILLETAVWVLRNSRKPKNKKENYVREFLSTSLGREKSGSPMNQSSNLWWSISPGFQGPSYKWLQPLRG